MLYNNYFFAFICKGQVRHFKHKQVVSLNLLHQVEDKYNLGTWQSIKGFNLKIWIRERARLIRLQRHQGDQLQKDQLQGHQKDKTNSFLSSKDGPLETS